MQALTLLQKFFSVDMVIYAAIVLVAATALARCCRSPAWRPDCAARLNHRHRKQAEQREKIVEPCFFSAILFPRRGRIFFAERRNARRARRDLRRDAVHQ